MSMQDKDITNRGMNRVGGEQNANLPKQEIKQKPLHLGEPDVTNETKNPKGNAVTRFFKGILRRSDENKVNDNTGPSSSPKARAVTKPESNQYASMAAVARRALPPKVDNRSPYAEYYPGIEHEQKNARLPSKTALAQPMNKGTNQYGNLSDVDKARRGQNQPIKQQHQLPHEYQTPRGRPEPSPSPATQPSNYGKMPNTTPPKTSKPVQQNYQGIPPMPPSKLQKPSPSPATPTSNYGKMPNSVATPPKAPAPAQQAYGAIPKDVQQPPNPQLKPTPPLPTNQYQSTEQFRKELNVNKAQEKLQNITQSHGPVRKLSNSEQGKITLIDKLNVDSLKNILSLPEGSKIKQMFIKNLNEWNITNLNQIDAKFCEDFKKELVNDLNKISIGDLTSILIK